MKKFLSLFLFLSAAWALNAEVVWNGSHNVGSWSSLQLSTAEYPALNHAAAGDLLVITIDEVEEGASVLFQAPTSPDWTNLFSQDVQAGVYRFLLTAENAALIQANGLAVNGQNFTFSKLEILYPTPLWVGTADGINGSGSWAQTSTIDKSYFANLSEGSILSIEVSSVGEGWSYANLRAGADWNSLSGVHGYDTPAAGTLWFALTADQVSTLQGSDIIDVTAQNLVVSGLYTYSDARYYVTGIGSNWSTVAYPMTLNEGVYEYTFTSSTSNNWNEYKITRGSWLDGYNWGPAVIDNDASELILDEYNDNGNIHFNAYGEDITICWNPETQKSWLKVSGLENLTVTVAGTASLLTTGWDVDNTDNDMQFEDGVFTWSRSAYYTSDEALNVEFKAVLAHDWNAGAFGKSNGSNQDYTFSAGYHDVLISFTWKDKSVTLTELNYPKQSLAGSFNSWTPVEMAWSANRNSCSAVVSLTQGETYSFRLKRNENTQWDGANSTMRRYMCSGWTLSENDDCSIVADETGDYTFTYYREAGVVTVTYPGTYTRHFDEVKYSTLCLPAAATLEGATAYSVASVEANTIILNEVGTELTAGVPYIIKPAAVGDVVATFGGLTVDAPVNNSLVGTFDGGVSLTAATNAYVLSENQFHLIAGTATATVGMYRAYLQLPDTPAPALRIIEAQNGATAIQDVEANETAHKFIQNGKLFILKNGITYDATGAVVR
jgi:hypothetical protein